MRCFRLLLLLACTITPLRAVELLYPFLRDGKWGYINSAGAWVIKPQYDRCIEIFEGDRVRVWQGEHWGYIDRTGKWIVEPRFTDPCLGNAGDEFEVVSIGKKQGILAHSGKLVLPVKYDEIVIFDDRAWVRSGEKLGLASLDGRWLMKPSMDWPHGREMPAPTDGGVSWFKRGKKWGLLSRDGRVLFEPQFDEHVMGRKEVEEWDHPEGLDFENGRAWVMHGPEYALISDEGKTLAQIECLSVVKYSEQAYGIRTKTNLFYLMDRNGNAFVKSNYEDIGELKDGMALVRDRFQPPDTTGRRPDFLDFGFRNSKGEMVVPFGKYQRAEPFSEGLAAVFNEGKGWGFINTEGQEIIPLKYWKVYQFRGGVAAVAVLSKPLPGMTSYTVPTIRWGIIDKTGRELTPQIYRDIGEPSEGLIPVGIEKPGATTDYVYDLRCGFIDTSGREVIPPQLGWAPLPCIRFCRDRAWVLKAGGEWDHAQYAMIDKAGKVLTDYVFCLPERCTTWIGNEYFGGRYSDGHYKYSEAEYLRKVRWRGDLAVISRGDFHNGLATADGKILVEPIFNSINEFHDGVAVARDSRGRDEKGNVKFVTALITERGEILANDKYTAVCDFDHGVAWASHRWTDHRGPYQHEGWGLIDTSAHELCELKYGGAWWVRGKGGRDTHNQGPVFYGELAPVSLADGFQPHVEKVWLNSWGYMNREGKIIAWHDKESGR